MITNVGVALTVTLIKLLVAGKAPLQGALGVSTKEMTSLLAIVITGLFVKGLNVAALAFAIFKPFFCH